MKIVAIYALLMCKIFGPKFWSCKFFDKSQVYKRSLEVTGLVISAIYRLLVMKDIRMRERTERVDKRKQTVQLVRRRRRMSLSP